MAFMAGTLAVALIAIIARRRFSRDMTRAEFRDRLRALEEHTHRH